MTDVSHSGDSLPVHYSVVYPGTGGIAPGAVIVIGVPPVPPLARTTETTPAAPLWGLYGDPQTNEGTLRCK